MEGNVVLRVYVVRHAQAYKNIPRPPGTPGEKLDSLTPKGLKQAATAGKLLTGRGIVAVITSPTGRTRQTADAIGRALELADHYVEDDAFGSIRNGKTPEGKATTWSWRKEQLKAGRDPRPTDGESFQDGIARGAGAIMQLAEKYAEALLPKRSSKMKCLVIASGGLPFGDRAFTFIAEAASDEDLDRLLPSSSMWSVMNWEVKPLQSLKG